MGQSLRNTITFLSAYELNNSTLKSRKGKNDRTKLRNTQISNTVGIFNTIIERTSKQQH